MKKLERMLLMNWHNFSLQVIPFEMITFLTGKNSSGKSTIIDAMQLVLLGDTSGTFFNKAANQKSTRTLQSYLFGEQGDDGEAGFMYKRSGHFMTYVALEFHDTELNSYFTASFAAECYKDRSFSHRKALKVLFYSFNSEAIKYVSENADLFTVATDNKWLYTKRCGIP